MVVVRHIPGDTNPADLFTKILTKQLFEKHRKTVLIPQVILAPSTLGVFASPREAPRPSVMGQVRHKPRYGLQGVDPTSGRAAGLRHRYIRTM